MSYHSEKVKRIWEEIEEYEKLTVFCSECSSKNTIYDNYCKECGHKLKHIPKNNTSYKKYCENCGSKLDNEDNYCGECGHKVIDSKVKICSVCGEWIGNGRYCSNCGHDTVKRSSLLCGNVEENILHILRSNDYKSVDVKRPKICPNCNTKYQKYFNYCECCGTKLIKK